MIARITVQALLIFLGALSIYARTIDVYPTGDSKIDIRRVRAAISAAVQNDVILLRVRNSAGQPQAFNWTGNDKDGGLVGPFGVMLNTANITLTGEILPSGQRAVIAGPVDGQNFPLAYPDPTPLSDPNPLVSSALMLTGGYANAAFFIGPRAANVTIKNLEFKNFEVVIGLLQTSSQPLADRYLVGENFSGGVRGFLFENNVITNCFSGIQGLGGNSFTARNNSITTVWKTAPDSNTLALLPVPVGIGNALLPLNASNSLPPGDGQTPGIIIEGNTINGPAVTTPGLPALSAAISVLGSKKTQIARNTTQGYMAGISLGAEGDSAIIGNTTTQSLYGIVVADGSTNGLPASNTSNATIKDNRSINNIKVVTTLTDPNGGIVENVQLGGGIFVEGDCNLILNNVVTPNTGPGLVYNDRANGNLFLGNKSSAQAFSAPAINDNANLPLLDLVIPSGPVPDQVPPASACWHLRNDRPAQFPMGLTVVRWTVTDTFHHQTVAMQNVTIQARPHD